MRPTIMSARTRARHALGKSAIGRRPLPALTTVRLNGRRLQRQLALLLQAAIPHSFGDQPGLTPAELHDRSVTLARVLSRHVVDARFRLPLVAGLVLAPHRAKRSGLPLRAEPGESAVVTKAPPTVIPSPPDVPAFDPYAFSVVAVLMKSGRDAAIARLKTIADPAHLRELAQAQHLTLPSDARAAEALRVAILASAERRLADRRAAAS
jgi:hypothetical protein